MMVEQRAVFTADINLRLDDVRVFSNGLAYAAKDGKVGYIDETGKTVIPFLYDEMTEESYGGPDSWTASAFNGGAVVVLKDGKCGLVDKTGAVVAAIEYDVITPADFDPLFLALKGEKWGIFDNKGKIVVPFEYTGFGMPKEGFVAAVKDDKVGYINLADGSVLLAYEWDLGFSFEMVRPDRAFSTVATKGSYSL